MKMPCMLVCLMVALAGCATAPALDPNVPARPGVSSDVVFEEVDGLVAVEAEHFFEQTRTDVRAWYLTTAAHTPSIEPDADGPHVDGAAGGAYLEILPDTRQTPADALVRGGNFTEDAGTMAVLSYRVHIHAPGRYYVWARIYSTGPDDNGLHVGLDGTWPPSGRRMQWIAKRRWVWGSKQRTADVHTGVPGLLYLDIDTPGEHTIHFAMREDGTEFDKWLMTLDRLDTVEGDGPPERVKPGHPPRAFGGAKKK